MNGDLRALTSSMELHSGVSPDVIKQVQKELDFVLPGDYVAFMVEHNGGEGPVGDEGYGAFWPVEGLPAVQSDYAELDHLRGWIIFGSTMSGEVFAFDREGSVLVVPLIGEREDAVLQGSFTEFVRRLAEGTIFDRRG